MKVSEERLCALRANNAASHKETRDCIKKALIHLLEKKPYNAISMTDIINKSGVSRSGVYKNYKNKDEIMFDIYNEPVNEVIDAMGSSIFENIDIIFTTGKKHEKEFKIILDAGLEHNILDLMNKRCESCENGSVSFYYSLWIGMIYNSFFEWVRTGMSDSVETTLERVREGLKQIACSIETDQTNAGTPRDWRSTKI